MKLLNRILVATDFSVAGERAVTRAGQLANQHAADLQIVHARGEVQLGKASEVICRAIASYQPSLVVAGARGEHEPRIAPAALGGTSLKLFSRMEYPLLLVRSEASRPYRTSLVAVQQVSELSRRVVRWGTALVPGGECHIVHAYDAPYSERMRLCGMDSAAVEACVLSTESAARESFDKLLAAATPDSRVHLHLEHGNPLGILVTEIARHDPQIVVVGRREDERGQSPRELSGSTGLRMAYHTPVDVLVIP